jgi:hypothetical protein
MDTIENNRINEPTMKFDIETFISNFLDSLNQQSEEKIQYQTDQMNPIFKNKKKYHDRTKKCEYKVNTYIFDKFKNGEIKICPYEFKYFKKQKHIVCMNIDCPYYHIYERLPKCDKGYDCPFLKNKKKCLMLHKINDECKYSERCTKIDCEFKHPPERITPCKFRTKCTKYRCKRWHPFGRKSPCNYGMRCNVPNCELVHPTRELNNNGIKRFSMDKMYKKIRDF